MIDLRPSAEKFDSLEFEGFSAGNQSSWSASFQG